MILLKPGYKCDFEGCVYKIQVAATALQAEKVGYYLCALLQYVHYTTILHTHYWFRNTFIIM